MILFVYFGSTQSCNYNGNFVSVSHIRSILRYLDRFHRFSIQATKLYFMYYLHVVIPIYSVRDKINLHLMPILLENLSFLFLYTPYLLFILSFEFNAISKDFITLLLLISDKFTIIIIVIGIIWGGSVILFSLHKTTCENTRTVHRKHVSQEVLSFFHLQRNVIYEKSRELAKGKGLGEAIKQ